MRFMRYATLQSADPLAEKCGFVSLCNNASDLLHIGTKPTLCQNQLELLFVRYAIDHVNNRIITVCQ